MAKNKIDNFMNSANYINDNYLKNEWDNGLLYNKVYFYNRRYNKGKLNSVNFIAEDKHSLPIDINEKIKEWNLNKNWDYSNPLTVEKGDIIKIDNEKYIFKGILHDKSKLYKEDLILINKNTQNAFVISLTSNPAAMQAFYNTLKKTLKIKKTIK